MTVRPNTLKQTVQGSKNSTCEQGGLYRLRRKRDPAQPNLPFDPMPDRVEPCLALLKAAPPVGPDWDFEIKWDGYRLAIHIEPKGVRIVTRGGHDWTNRFPAIAAAAKELGVGTAILDGEAVVLNSEGRSDFGALQRSLGGRGGKRALRNPSKHGRGVTLGVAEFYTRFRRYG